MEGGAPDPPICAPLLAKDVWVDAAPVVILSRRRSGMRHVSC
jgi:hypothetical protein